MEDGKLHKGFYFRDGNYMFGKKRKRGLSKNSSDYYGLPYRIYSATPGYVYKNDKNYIGNFTNK